MNRIIYTWDDDTYDDNTRDNTYHDNIWRDYTYNESSISIIMNMFKITHAYLTTTITLNEYRIIYGNNLHPNQSKCALRNTSETV